MAVDMVKCVQMAVGSDLVAVVQDPNVSAMSFVSAVITGAACTIWDGAAANNLPLGGGDAAAGSSFMCLPWGNVPVTKGAIHYTMGTGGSGFLYYAVR